MITEFDDLETEITGKADNRPVVFTENCPKCHGTGRFYSHHGLAVGPCFVCKGTGKLEYKTPARERAKARASEAKAKAGKAETNLSEFAIAYPAHNAWIAENAPTFEFARSMSEAVGKYGHLTPGQLAAVERCMVRESVKVVERKEKAATAAEIDVSRIVTLFGNARKALLKKPVLRVGEITLSLAAESSKNPGSVYVKNGETYLGKISPEGIYAPSFAATAETIELVKATAEDPLGIAVAYGRRTGNCACCGRTLTNRVSVELGIGPICRDNWGM